MSETECQWLLRETAETGVFLHQYTLESADGSIQWERGVNIDGLEMFSMETVREYIGTVRQEQARDARKFRPFGTLSAHAHKAR